MISFHTNLDEAKSFVDALNVTWDEKGPVPRKGERVSFVGNSNFVFQLEVSEVTYTQKGKAVVELHMPSYKTQDTIASWTKWFRECQGK